MNKYFNGLKYLSSFSSNKKLAVFILSSDTKLCASSNTNKSGII